MSKIESRTGIIRISDEKIFTFLTDFTNFGEFMPPDKVKNFRATHESCDFEIDGIGRMGLEIIEKIPNKLIHIRSREGIPLNFSLMVNIDPQDANTSLVKISIEPDANMFIMAMVKSPLQDLADTLIGQLEKLSF